MGNKSKEKDTDAIDKIMNIIYDGKEVETGKDLLGHQCINEKDEEHAKKEGASILYGEILPKGLNKALDEKHLDIQNAKIAYDAGCGSGKIILRTWLSNTNISRAVGIELSETRYLIGEKAILNLLDNYKEFKKLEYKKGKVIKIMDKHCRIFVLRCDNLFNDAGIQYADIIICNTDFPKELMKDLTSFLARAKKGARIMSYKKLKKSDKIQQLKINKDKKKDIFLASWNKNQPGHHFYLWSRI